MKRKLLIVGLLVLSFSFGLMGCKNKSNESNTTQVPENEGVAYFMEYCEELWPSTTFQIEEIMDVTNYYDDEDVEQIYCIGSTSDAIDQYNLVIVYEVDGVWALNWSGTADKTCADEFD